MSVIEITEDTILSGDPEKSIPLLLDFWAPWCVHCRRIEAAVKETAEKYEGRCMVGKVNVDENRALASTYLVESIPAFILLKNGTEQGRLTAPGSRAELERFLEEKL